MAVPERGRLAGQRRGLSVSYHPRSALRSIHPDLAGRWAAALGLTRAVVVVPAAARLAAKASRHWAAGVVTTLKD